MATVASLSQATRDLLEKSVVRGADLVVTDQAALGGTDYGLQIILETANSNVTYAYAEIAVSVTGQIRTRIYLDPNTLEMADGDQFVVLALFNTDDDEIANVKLAKSGSDYQIISTVVEDDDSWTTVQTDTITDEEHYIEFHLQRASSDVASDGSMQTWIDGVSEGTASGLDNYDKMPPTYLRFGAIEGVDSGTSGVLYLDELEANDDGSEIGPVGEAPPPESNAVYKNDANLQALWLMEEESGTRYDYTPNDNDLTDNNTVGSSVDAQEGSRSADFERSNSEYLSITDGDQTGLDITGDLTICCWVKPESLGAVMYFVSKWATTDNQRSYMLYTYGVANGDVTALLSDNGTDAVGANTVGGVLAVDTWAHVAVVYNGTDIRIYVNGALSENGSDNPASYSGGIYNGTAEVHVGGRDGSTNYFDGLIDEAAVFDRALSADEIADIYNNGIRDPGQAGCLVGGVRLTSLVGGKLIE